MILQQYFDEFGMMCFHFTVNFFILYSSLFTIIV